MITWTTPTLMLTLKGVQLGDNISAVVTVEQGGKKYTFENPEMQIVGCNTVLTVDMTQEQTGGLMPGIVKVQVNWTDGYGHRNATKIKSAQFGDNLMKEVL